MEKLTPIPLTMGYFATIDGGIYDPKLNRLKTYINGDGYITACVRLLSGRLSTMGVHRLLAMTFITCPGMFRDYVVNHRDLDVQNNKLENLEWVTALQNNIHAALFRESVQRVNIACEVGGKKLFFIGIESASSSTNISVLDIWDSIKLNRAVRGHLFTYVDNKAIPVELHNSKRFKKGVKRSADFYTPRKIWIKDIDSGLVTMFKSVADAAREFNVNKSHIIISISTPKVTRLFNSGYLVSDTGDFPEITPELIEARRASSGKTVIAYFLATGTWCRYKSASLFITTNNLSKKAVTTALKDNKIVNKGGWLFLYDTETNYKRLCEFIADLNGSVPESV